jgi:hypothetical protein
VLCIFAHSAHGGKAHTNLKADIGKYKPYANFGLDFMEPEGEAALDACARGRTTKFEAQLTKAWQGNSKESAWKVAAEALLKNAGDISKHVQPTIWAKIQSLIKA